LAITLTFLYNVPGQISSKMLIKDKRFLHI